ncbi:DUF4440 domain-containing protein [Formosa maritima]|uniref:Nuclear transport factor 2 family protein n=1 Tax=Formosa maritima TaxID=2592046 RepID=A0A5D0GEA7_9FLAO|nr:DUF4440 domain-containing protein [Formosa maritima]TYA57275.1 nuclear transport factor 2 family protein [Formosa maritima]
MRTVKILFLICFMVNAHLYSQNETTLKAIDNQVWMPFTKAFETFDYSLFASIHSIELIRINADNKRIQDKISYITGYKERWKTKEMSQTISFRFFERFNNEHSASERGIYKLTIYPDTDKEQSYYGQFHVILKNENGNWKILVDYDSSEKNTVDSTLYYIAFPIDDYSKY